MGSKAYLCVDGICVIAWQEAANEGAVWQDDLTALSCCCLDGLPAQAVWCHPVGAQGQCWGADDSGHLSWNLVDNEGVLHIGNGRKCSLGHHFALRETGT